MDHGYFTRRLLETLALADETPDADERAVHIRASRYYRDLLQSCDSRSAVRHKVRISAMLHRVGAMPRAVVVSDLSTCGFRVQLRQPVRPGRIVGLQMDGLTPLDAYVVWQRDGEVGCKFLTELHPALLEAAIAVSPHID